MYQKWSEFYTLMTDEKLILEYDKCKFYYKPTDALTHYDSEGTLIFTKKRLVGFSAQYKGLVNRKFIGFDKVEFDELIEDIDHVEIWYIAFSEAIVIRVKHRRINQDSLDFMIKFNDKKIIRDFSCMLKNEMFRINESKSIQ